MSRDVSTETLNFNVPRVARESDPQSGSRPSMRAWFKDLEKGDYDPAARRAAGMALEGTGQAGREGARSGGGL